MAEAAPLSLTNRRHPAAAQRLRVRATYASLAVAVLLIAAKFVAWYHVGVGTGMPGSVYSSVRVNNKDPLPAVGLGGGKQPEVKG